MREGWRFEPSWKLPEGYSLREDEDCIYLYSEKPVAIFSAAAYTSVKQAKEGILKEIAKHENREEEVTEMGALVLKLKQGAGQFTLARTNGHYSPSPDKRGVIEFDAVPYYELEVIMESGHEFEIEGGDLKTLLQEAANLLQADIGS